MNCFGRFKILSADVKWHRAHFLKLLSLQIEQCLCSCSCSASKTALFRVLFICNFCLRSDSKKWPLSKTAPDTHPANFIRKKNLPRPPPMADTRILCGYERNTIRGPRIHEDARKAAIRPGMIRRWIHGLTIGFYVGSIKVNGHYWYLTAIGSALLS